MWLEISLMRWSAGWRFNHCFLPCCWGFPSMCTVRWTLCLLGIVSIWGSCLVPHKKIRDDWFYWLACAVVIRATSRSTEPRFCLALIVLPEPKNPALIWIWYDSKVPIMYIHARPCSLSAPARSEETRGEDERRDKVNGILEGLASGSAARIWRLSRYL